MYHISAKFNHHPTTNLTPTIQKISKLSSSKCIKLTTFIDFENYIKYH